MTQLENISEPVSLSWTGFVKAIWFFAERQRASFAFWNVVLFLVYFYRVVPSLILAQIVNFFVRYHKGDALTTVYWYCAILAGSYIVVALIRLTAKKQLDKIGIKLRSRAKVWGFERLIDFSLVWHSQENSGSKVQKILTGSQAAEDLLRLLDRQGYQTAAVFIGVIAVFVFIKPAFAVFIVIYLTIFFGIEYLFNRRIIQLSDSYNKANERSSGVYVESTHNLLSVKALGAEQHLHLLIGKREAESRYWQYERVDWSTNKWYSFQTVNALAFALGILLASYYVANGQLSTGVLLIVFNYFSTLREVSGDASDLLNDIITKRSDFARMMPIFTETSLVPTGQDEFPDNWKSIRLTNAQFRYASGAVGVQDLNFELRRGEKLGIAGASGSGKSTLVKLFLGLYALKEGSFIIGGKNYYDLAHDEVIQQISVVLQEAELFNFSLRENITLTRDVKPELLEKAVQIAELNDLIQRLPEGLETLVGEKGYSLSGGERQRVGIARAIAKNAPILLLDEATSALDAVTEQKIMLQLLGDYARGKTFLIIAHRLATLRNTDRVVVFDHGKAHEEGTFEELAKRPESTFGQLYNLQMNQTS